MNKFIHLVMMMSKGRLLYGDSATFTLVQGMEELTHDIWQNEKPPKLKHGSKSWSLSSLDDSGVDDNDYDHHDNCSSFTVPNSPSHQPLRNAVECASSDSSSLDGSHSSRPWYNKLFGSKKQNREEVSHTK
ncbi:MAG: hypothetical protein PV345_05605 [Wolbachia sp.]|nr:hypothetical protein [Wolbachia sp.]